MPKQATLTFFKSKKTGSGIGHLPNLMAAKQPMVVKAINRFQELNEDMRQHLKKWQTQK